MLFKLLKEFGYFMYPTLAFPQLHIVICNCKLFQKHGTSGRKVGGQLGGGVARDAAKFSPRLCRLPP